MAQNETARTTVYLDGKQAEAALGALADKAKDLRKDLNDALEAGDNVKFNKLRNELSRVESVQKSVTKESFDVQSVLMNINKVSWKDLEKAQKAVIAQMKGMTRGTEEYAAKQKDLGLLRAELSGISGVATKQTGILGKLRDTAAQLLPAFGLAAIALGLKNIFSTADQSYVKFEERVDNLSALTGLEGEQLDWLSKKAKETSVSTVEGNVRITQSAESIVDAYTKVGSQRPELLKVKEDLASVSQEAIILSAAAKSELQPAVEGLTMTLNQFDMAADQSRRIINVLAAGSMVGAGEIPYLTEAMEKSGTTANLMKIPLEQWAGAIESIAPFYKQASEAGNSFDKVLLTMKQKQIGYVNGVFDLNTALDQLEKRYASGESATDIFLKEHSKMGELLVLNRGKMDEYTRAVTGSNIAIEQAAKNTDNEAARRAQAQNGINNLYLEFGEKIAPLITRGITSGTELLKIAIEYRAILIPLTAALAAYAVMAKLKVFWDVAQKGSVILASAAQALFTGNLTRATAAMRLFNTVTKLNPFILLASFIASAGIAMFAYTKRADAAAVAQRSINEISVTAQQNIASERVELQQLLKVAQNEALSKVARQEAMAKINLISPEYLGGLTLEKINTEQATTAVKQYILSLEKKAKAQANFDRMVEIQKEESSLNAGIGGEPGVGTKVWNAVSRPFLYNQLNASSKQKNINARLEELRIEKLSLNDDTSSNYIPPPKPSGGSGGNGGKPTETPEEKKEREKKEKDALKKEKDVRKTALEELKAAYDDRLVIIKNAYLNEGLAKEEYEARMEMASLAHLEAQKQLLILQKQDTTSIELEIADARIKIQADAYTVIEDLAKKYDEQAKAQQETVVSQIEETIKSVDDLINELDEIKKQEIDINQERAKSYLDLAGSVGDSFADTLMSQEQDFGQFLKNTLVMALDALEKILIMQITETTLKAIGNAWNPVAVASAVAKIVLMKAAFGTAKAIILGGGKKGKQSGGYADSDSNDSTPVGVYHANEFIASGPAVRNPTIKPVLDIIDIAQRSGTIRSLNLPAMLGQAGRQSGGYASPASQSSGIPSSGISGRDPELISAIKELNYQLKAGIKASVNKFGHGGIDESISDINKFNALTK